MSQEQPSPKELSVEDLSQVAGGTTGPGPDKVINSYAKIVQKIAATPNGEFK